jgi:signal transduction histidine kinase
MNFNLLDRQLQRMGIDKNTIPTIEKWKELLQRIEKTYQEVDQERYLNELAMKVSSRETQELNTKLENAQHIAHLGYWHFDGETQKIIWSKEMYQLFGVDPSNPIPSYDELMKRIEESDRKILSNLIAEAFKSCQNYEIEVRVTKMDDVKGWLYIAGTPHIEPDKAVRYLSGIAMDITNRKMHEKEMHLLNQQLIASARRAGMAEVATSVLHNIGNILNSIIISITFLKKYMHELDIENILTALEMIKNHENNLATFFTEDPKGKLLPQYFCAVKPVIEKDISSINDEINHLNDSILHIKDIVKMQNVLSGVSKLVEKLSLPDIIDEAINITGSSFKKYGIHLEKNYDDISHIFTDKNKIMQIIVNLIQNAKDALIVTDIQDKKIIISIHENKEHINITVSDNGIGIDLNDQSKLFTFGFTTKPKGHGFGLHSSALLAKELGGALNVTSDGIGHGSNFILEIPLIHSLDGRSIHEHI